MTHGINWIGTLLLAACAALSTVHLSSPGLAETAQPHQPYKDFDQRAIKALSDHDIADLRAGRGMMLALAAELNGYPGPVHVLQHADALDLTPPQRERTQALFQAMQAEAVALGERLIGQEKELDFLFATKTVTAATLQTATAAIGATQAALRAAHLRYHLAMTDVLTPEQVQRYAQLRGYSGPDAERTREHRHH
jgi:Spy/CpxP family protein refolding chaperone